MLITCPRCGRQRAVRRPSTKSQRRRLAETKGAIHCAECRAALIQRESLGLPATATDDEVRIERALLEMGA